MAATDHDERSGYCRILGHHLRFAYCRSGSEGKPCPKILDCWFESFDVLEFVRQNHPEVLERVQPPKTKVTTLVELIQQAQQRTG